MSSVDVIVPCYRYGHFLKECVESVLAQSGPDLRVLIIDDASPDDSAEVAAQLVKRTSRVTLVRHSVNKGHITTYNEGIEWSSAEYLLLLSADDYLLPGALNRAVTLMAQHPEVGFTFGNAAELDEQGTRTLTDVILCHNGERILTGREFIMLSGARNIVPTPTAVVRTQLQKEVGGYRAELPHSGDMEMWLRLSAHAFVGFVEAPQAVCRRHTRNMSLAYMAQSWLPDLEQRRIAFDWFFQTCGHMIHESSYLRGNLLYLLACEAVSHASGAFNDGEMELSDRLAALAVQTCPVVTRSSSWRKLAVKRRIGLRAWRALRPAINGICQSLYPLSNCPTTTMHGFSRSGQTNGRAIKPGAMAQ